MTNKTEELQPITTDPQLGKLLGELIVRGLVRDGYSIELSSSSVIAVTGVANGDLFFRLERVKVHKTKKLDILKK
jgi:hypothetical protein